ncbi:MAG: dipeptide-binding transporter [Frankiales bacterium]|jgi:peptide/nickel transport system substrate-binding protein|nr:dipeptide-binding transporter [Frankiales bacterium]
MRNLRRRGVIALGLAGLLAGTAACGGGDGGNDGGSGGDEAGGTMVFGTSSDPVSMDGAYVSDGESLRVVRQLFETLVTTEPGGTEIVPLLAKEWESSEDGTSWTFTLQEGVKFHDGTDFNAEAVCANFDRWYNFKGVQQSASVSYYWQTVFSGYAKNEDPALGTSLYKDCQAQDGKAVINLTSASASFLSGLALASFSIASPEALTKYEADKVTGTGEEPRFEGTFGTQNPVGTGPFKLETYEPNNRLVLARFDDYWGDKSKLDKVIFKPIADGPARRQALEAGEIQGYDLVDPADLGALEGAGFQIVERPAFNVGYVGFNTAKKPFDNIKIRQAVAHALNRQALVTAKYPPGAEVAKQFMPPSLFGYASDVPEYEYSVEKAKALIAESGVANPTIEFWYPTGVSRPYMPDPVANFQAFSADLTAAGFTVVPKSAPWNPDYLNAVDTGGTGMRLLGWTGDFGDPDNFVGTFFRTKQTAWGPLEESIYTDLEAARQEPDEAKRTSLYEAANKKIMEFLPGVPYVHTKPALAFAKGVEGYVPSPVSIEDFSKVSLSS